MVTFSQCLSQCLGVSLDCFEAVGDLILESSLWLQQMACTVEILKNYIKNPISFICVKVARKQEETIQ